MTRCRARDCPLDHCGYCMGHMVSEDEHSCDGSMLADQHFTLEQEAWDRMVGRVGTLGEMMTRDEFHETFACEHLDCPVCCDPGDDPDALFYGHE